MEKSFGLHKDCPPQKTIQKILSILSEIDLIPCVESINSFGENCYSVRLVDSEFPVGTNGKGVSKIYALASAYAEFMERLQNGCLYQRNYGLMPDNEVFYSDEILIKTKNLLENQKGLLKNIFGNPTTDLDGLVDILGEDIRAVPFYNISQKRVEFLPSEIIKISLGSNGMCAGNTPEEALVQGLGEILERFALREIFLKDISIPTIPLTEVKNIDTYGIIEELINRDYSILLKDCSLGGKVPVLGVVLFNRKRTKYRVALGSDPVFEVALHRGLTEVVQGYDQNTVEDGMLDMSFSLDDHLAASSSPSSPSSLYSENKEQKILEFLKATKDGHGQLPQSFFFSKGKPLYKQVFQSRVKSNSRLLKYLVKLIQGLGYQIYIRDVSFLGFPTYHIYIPGLSELMTLNETNLKTFFREMKLLQKYLLNLKNLSQDELEKCTSMIKNLPSHFIFEDYRFLSRIVLNDSSSLGHMHNLLLLTFLCRRQGDYKSAFRYLKTFLDQKGMEEDLGYYSLAYYRCALHFLKLKAEGYDEDEITNSLAGIYGVDLAKEVIGDVFDPLKTFQYLSLPACGNCNLCPVQKQCYYPRWKGVTSQLVEKARQNSIDQNRLKNLHL